MSYKDRILNKRSTQYEIIKFKKLKIYNRQQFYKQRSYKNKKADIQK